MSTSRQTDSTLRIGLLVLAAIVLVPMVMMTLAFSMFGMGGGMMGGYGGAGVAPWWGLGIALVWLVVFVGGGYLAYRWYRDGGARTDAALDELRLAYARGDLSAEEFEQRRAKLSQK